LVFGTLKPLVHLVDVLLKSLHIADILHFSSHVNLSDGMNKLAPGSIGAVHLFVVLLAELGFVLGGHMLLLLELCLPVGEGAGGSKLAFSKLFPVLAHFCFVLALV